MSKADGTKIVIEFDQPIISGVSGSEASFVITVPEYDYVPGGPISNHDKSVASIEYLGESQTGLTDSTGVKVFTVSDISGSSGIVEVSKRGYKRKLINIDDLSRPITIELESVGILPDVPSLQLHLDAGVGLDFRNDIPYTVSGLQVYLDSGKEDSHE